MTADRAPHGCPVTGVDRVLGGRSAGLRSVGQSPVSQDVDGQTHPSAGLVQAPTELLGLLGEDALALYEQVVQQPLGVAVGGRAVQGSVVRCGVVHDSMMSRLNRKDKRMILHHRSGLL